MKKQRKIIAVIMCVVLIATVVPFALFASAVDYVPYTGQTSAETDATNTGYIIQDGMDAGGTMRTAEYWMSILAARVNSGDLYTDVQFRLDTDLDMTDYAADWVPIGNNATVPANGDTPAYRTVFGGTFDGNGHIVTGLNLDDEVTAEDGTSGHEVGAHGLFGYVSGTIANLTVANSEMNFKSAAVVVGPIAASLESGGTITNCSTYNVEINVESTPDILAIVYAGGIVAQSKGTVSNSYSSADIYATAPSSLLSIGFVGGIVGVVSTADASVSNTYFSGNATCGSFSRGGAAGGIVAQMSEATIENSYSVGKVNGLASAAICPMVSDGGSVSNSYYLSGSAKAGYALYDSATGEYSAPGTDCATFDIPTGDPIVPTLTAAQLSGAFTDPEASAGYPFPVLTGVANVIPAANTSEFAGGNGTIYSPYLISTTAHLDNVRNYLSANFKLVNDIIFHDYEYNTAEENKDTIADRLSDRLSGILDGTTLGGLVDSIRDGISIPGIDSSLLGNGRFSAGYFPTIGKADTPFTGTFDGDGHTIYNLVIAGSDNAALFAYNRGIIKDFTISETVIDDVEQNGAEYEYSVATKKSTVTVVTGDTEKTAYAAGVAVWNAGEITGVTNNADVIACANSMSMYGAGITAVNSGKVDNCTNTGVILAAYEDAVVFAEGADLATIDRGANIYVAGLVAHNMTLAELTNSTSSDTARSQLTSPANVEDNINEGQYYAINDGTATGLTNAVTTKKYLKFTLSNISYEEELNATTNPVPASDYTGTVYVGAATADPAVTPDITYSAVDNHYQKVRMTYTHDGDVFTTDYIVWFKLDIVEDSIQVDATGKQSFLAGDGFSTSGLGVTYKNSEDQSVSLYEVPDYNSNGYVVKLYRDAACTDEINIANFASQPEGTYYVAVTYGDAEGVLRTEGDTSSNKYTYTINIYDINTISAVADYESYLEGQVPTLTVTATYTDPAGTQKVLSPDKYDYEFGTNDGTFVARNTGDLTSLAADDTAIRVTTQTNAGETKETIVDVSVITDAEVAVENLTATTSNDSETENGVTGDNVRLTWTKNEHASSYEVYRKPTSSATWTSLGRADYVNEGVSSCTDTTSVAGTAYDYKVVPIVGGAAVEDGSSAIATTQATAAMPTHLSLDTSKVKTEYVLNSNLNTSNLVVKAHYRNQSEETLQKGYDITLTTKYYINTSEFTSTTPGTKTINIYYNNTNAQDVDGNNLSYNVTVLAPTGIVVTRVPYSAYPVNYPEADFKNGLSISYTYDGTSTRSRVNNFTLPNYAEISGTPTESPVTLTVEASNMSDTSPATLSTTASVRFVPNNPPTIDPASCKSDAVGVNSLKSTKVDGAVRYELLRSDTLAGEYTKVANGKLPSGASAVEYTDPTAVGGNTYYYKVVAVIANQATAPSAASPAILTTAPKYVRAFWDGKVDYTHYFAIKDPIKTEKLVVYGFYADSIGANDATTVSTFNTVQEWKTAGFTERALDANQYSIDTSAFDNASPASAGTAYPVIVSYNGNAQYGPVSNLIPVGEFDAIPCGVIKISAKANKAKYPKDYTLVSSDLTVTLTYGYNNGTEDVVVSEARAKADEYIIDCPSVGTNTNPRNLTVTAAADNNVTATIPNAYQIYDLNAIPRALTAEDSGAGTINIAFNGTNFPADKYQIYRKALGDSDFTQIAVLKNSDGQAIGQDTAFVYGDAGVETGKQYTYYVTPIYNFSDSGMSSPEVTVTLTSFQRLAPTAGSGYDKETEGASSMITHITPKTGVSAFIGKMENSSYVKVFKPNGTTEVTSGNVGTGYIAKLIVDEVVVDQATIIVKGDLNGDGVANIADAMNIKDSILGKTSLNNIKKIAGDINGANNNGDNQINIADFMLLKDYILNKTTIK